MTKEELGYQADEEMTAEDAGAVGLTDESEGDE